MLSSNEDLKARLKEALARVESLERENRNMKARERRTKNTLNCLLEDLGVKKLLNKEFKEFLNIYPVHKSGQYLNISVYSNTFPSFNFRSSNTSVQTEP